MIFALVAGRPREDDLVSLCYCELMVRTREVGVYLVSWRSGWVEDAHMLQIAL